MWINLNGTKIEFYDFKNVYLEESDISELINKFKEEIVYQLVNNHKEELVEELLEYGIVLNNRDLDDVYLKYFGKISDEILSIKQYYEKEGKDLEENLVNVMNEFFEKREANELIELVNKINNIQSEIRHLKLNITIAGIASLASIFEAYLLFHKRNQS